MTSEWFRISTSVGWALKQLEHINAEKSQGCLGGHFRSAEGHGSPASYFCVHVTNRFDVRRVYLSFGFQDLTVVLFLVLYY